MESFESVQEDIRDKIMRAKVNLKKSPKERITTSYVETRLENLEQLWTSFYNNHNQMLQNVKKANFQVSDYYKNGLYDIVEDLYIDLKNLLKEMLINIKGTSNKSELGSSSCDQEGRIFSKVKLPEIKIASFSGKYSEWSTFRDLFVGLVHDNRNIEDSQKFYYLKGHLTGEAEQLLRNIKVTSDNYKIAWDKLNSTYNNKRFLTNNILKRLFNQKTILHESASEIKSLVHTTTECLDSIKNLGVDVASWDILIIYIISQRLDKETWKAWELMISAECNDQLPNLVQFFNYLNSRFRGLESLEGTPDGCRKERMSKETQSFHILKNKQGVSCSYCSADHKITTCTKFGKQSNEQRREFVREKGLCFICLNANHAARFCKSFFKCQVCKRRHHTLLHPTGVSGLVDENTSATHEDNASSRQVDDKGILVQTEGPSHSLVSHLSTGNCRNTVLLATALVKAQSKDGSYLTVRALLDQGSQGSFVTEAMVQQLGLKKSATKNTVLGVGGQKSVISKYTVSVNLRSRKDTNLEIRITAYVLKSVTALLPVTKVTKEEWANLTDEDLADPDYYRPNKIDILLGAEVYSRVIQAGIKKNSNGTLLAQDTALGWILSGVSAVDTSNVYSHITVMHSSLQADDLLKRFWELEDEPSEAKKMLTEEEQRCEELFSSTTKRDERGRYIVRLPFCETNLVEQHGESKSIAVKRQIGLESRLSKNIQLKNEYARVIKEYLDLNHMEKVTDTDLNNKPSIYLPHHAVIREDKVTTKVCVVFDASCKGSNGMSLNDHLMVGPTLQADLRHIIMRWRKHPICLAADIEKMYRMVQVDRQDSIFQRIVWRDSSKEEMEEYELITVTFGTASAPYLAVRALHQVAYDECQSEPEIAKLILNDFYVDDFMSGAENVEQGLNIYNKINTVLLKCGFKLQKWVSNSSELIYRIKDGERNKDELMDIEMDNITKILGLTWNSSDDVFQYSVKLPPLSAPVTKRKIISDISRLFDPLGWLAPTIILAKVFIQRLWLAGLSWDQEITNNLVSEWVTYRTNLISLMNIKIPRWLHTCSHNVKTELHGFSDASKVAYAASIYLRVIDSRGNIHVSLVTSKTKVAPIKQVSIPRLELCGAVLLAKLIAEVGRVMEVPKVDWHTWTNSEVVLAWLSSHPSRWKTFVANRVSHILTILDSRQWSHVASKHNPADCASRGITPAELEVSSIWWNGPEFLRQQDIQYKSKSASTDLEEVKVHTVTIDFQFWNRFSSLSRLVRVIAYCRRFLNVCRKRSQRHYTRYLDNKELEDALQICVRRCQEEEFASELKELKKNMVLENKSSNLKSLNIFLDSNEIIRVGGRLEMSQLGYNRVHPILIPKESFLTNMLIADAHHKTLHGGPQLMVTYLRSRYWVVGVKLLAKKYVRGCIRCIRYASSTRTQLMGQLPSARVTPNKPFLCSGVDYAGPISMRTSKGRGNKSFKGYIALFICMSTRAVHLEAVSDLSARGFVTAFKRFVARRGRVAELYSDNGTNFVGAARELLHLFHEEKSGLNEELAEYLSNNGTQWSFIPPHAPNFGAGIRSTKFHLKRVIGNSTLTFEEMATVLAQIEACLNSRPFSYVEDHDKLTILTPGHFLVGEPLVIVPDLNYEKSNIHSLTRWQLHQRMTQDFWRRWSKDYLNQFLQRHKWAYRTPEPTVGDVVLVKEDDLPPGKWLLGRVVQKHPGPDKITRVVTLRTQNSQIKRPTSKLCLLPVAK